MLATITRTLQSQREKSPAEPAYESYRDRERVDFGAQLCKDDPISGRAVFTTYIALSAARSKSSGRGPWTDASEIPMLADAAISCPSTLNGSASAWWTRCSTASTSA